MEPRGPPLLPDPPVLEEEPPADNDDPITDEPAALDDVDAGAEVPEDVALEDVPGRLVDPTDDNDDDDDGGETCELDRTTLEDPPDAAPDDDAPPPDDGVDVPAAEDATPDEDDDEAEDEEDDEDPDPDVAVHPAAATPTRHIIPSPPRAARILPPCPRRQLAISMRPAAPMPPPTHMEMTP